MSELEPADLTHLTLQDDDDPAFIEIADAVLRAVVRQTRPQELWIVRIDNWFGDRWVSFSGQTHGTLGIRHPQELRMPPFVPSRVVSESYYRRAGDADELAPASAPIRLHIKQPSSANFTRQTGLLTPNATLAWVSGKSAATGRGALMVYHPSPEGHMDWYAGFERQASWRVVKAVKIAREQLTALEAAGRATSRASPAQ